MYRQDDGMNDDSGWSELTAVQRTLSHCAAEHDPGTAFIMRLGRGCCVSFLCMVPRGTIF